MGTEKNHLEDAVRSALPRKHRSLEPSSLEHILPELIQEQSSSEWLMFRRRVFSCLCGRSTGTYAQEKEKMFLSTIATNEDFLKMYRVLRPSSNWAYFLETYKMTVYLQYSSLPHDPLRNVMGAFWREISDECSTHKREGGGCTGDEVDRAMERISEALNSSVHSLVQRGVDGSFLRNYIHLQGETYRIYEHLSRNKSSRDREACSRDSFQALQETGQLFVHVSTLTPPCRNYALEKVTEFQSRARQSLKHMALFCTIVKTLGDPWYFSFLQSLGSEEQAGAFASLVQITQFARHSYASELAVLAKRMPKKSIVDLLSNTSSAVIFASNFSYGGDFYHFLVNGAFLAYRENPHSSIFNRKKMGRALG